MCSCPGANGCISRERSRREWTSWEVKRCRSTNWHSYRPLYWHTGRWWHEMPMLVQRSTVAKDHLSLFEETRWRSSFSIDEKSYLRHTVLVKLSDKDNSSRSAIDCRRRRSMRRSPFHRYCWHTIGWLDCSQEIRPTNAIPHQTLENVSIENQTMKI